VKERRFTIVLTSYFDFDIPAGRIVVSHFIGPGLGMICSFLAASD